MAEIDITGAFGAVKSESRYLNDRLDVQSARNKRFEADKKLASAKRIFKQTSTTDKNYQQVLNAVKAAEKELQDAVQETSRIESLARNDYRQAKAKIEQKKETSEIGKINKQIDIAQDALKRQQDLGQDTTQQKAIIADLIAQRDKTGKYAAKPTAAATTGATPGEQKTTAEARNYQNEITNAAKIVNAMSPQARKDLSSLLKAAGYRVVVSDIYNDQLVSEYQKALADNQGRSTALSQEIPWAQFLQAKINETNVLKGVGAGGVAVPTGTVSISTATEAASKVEDAFQSVLKRLPTAEEVSKYSKILNTEEKKASSITKGTVKTIGGVKYTEYTGGIDRAQFLSDLVRKNFAKEIEQAGLVPSDVAQRAKNKEAYVKAFDAAKGDKAKIDKLNQTTSYGLAITGLKNRIKANADKAGASYDDAQLDSWAKEIYDTNQDADATTFQNFLNNKFTFGGGQYKGAAAANINDLKATAIANGIDLDKAFSSQLPNWLADLNKGGNIDTYKKIIRDVAKIGMPEKISKLIDQGIDLKSIYSPYQNLMETVLELPRGSITLDNPTLRSAITAEGEVPMYQFERQLRKDPRWPYTENARQEVSSAALKILRDFGFQG